LSAPTDNQIYAVPANQFSPSAGTTLLANVFRLKIDEGQQKIKIKIVRTNQQSNLRNSCQSIFSLSRHHPIRKLPLSSEAVSKKGFILLKHNKASQVDSMPARKALFVDVDGVGAVGGAPCAR